MEDCLSIGGPPQFQRMLSWQLSQVVDYTDIGKTRKKNKKARRRESTDNEPPEVDVNPQIERVKSDAIQLLTVMARRRCSTQLHKHPITAVLSLALTRPAA